MATKVLVAEDDTDIRNLIAFSLRFGGFEVVEASNGQEAVERTLAEKPDLVLMDVRMPKVTGYEACRQLKARDETKHIPVIFLSAKGQETEIQQGLDAGAEDYILKPFAPDELANRVREVVQRVSQERQ
ncbi:MAG: response regulator transcription factor [Anaerolineae bacterium]